MIRSLNDVEAVCGVADDYVRGSWAAFRVQEPRPSGVV
jgi:hypothetical protein